MSLTVNPGTWQSPTEDNKLALLRRALRASTFTILLFFGGIGGWLYVARLDSAAVAPGILENAASTKTVQHLEGGIVVDIIVRDGDQVAAGDLLARLDPTRDQATADLYRTQLWTTRARMERLEAEVQLADTIRFQGDLLEAAQADPTIARAIRDEERQFDIARETLAQRRELLRTQAEQARVEIDGHLLRKKIAEEELALVAEDLENTVSLRERGLANQATVTELRRARLALEERIAQAEIDVARLNQEISGFKLQIAQVQEEYRQRAAELLEAVTRDSRSLERDAIVATDMLDRIELRAPVTGTVQESILNTTGAVIQPGEEIMKVVPLTTDYIITAKVSPNDIESILPGAPAQITFPAFQSIEMKPAEGKLTVLSRDRIVDTQAQEEYYEAEVVMDEDTVNPEIRDRLVAGMAVSVVLPTGERTALEYLLSPMIKRLRTAMREE